jgi:uncharacterized protein YcbK (DUF882 family)
MERILVQKRTSQWLIGARALAMAALLIPAGNAQSRSEKRLSFYHTHTQETLEITYAAGGEYIDSALTEINEFMGDFRTGDSASIDPELLDFIYDVRESLGSKETFEVISAYRSPKTNEMLRATTGGVAQNSQHLLARAIDVRLRGTDSEDLRNAAIASERGGVGYYEESDFVHLDTGRVRTW